MPAISQLYRYFLLALVLAACIYIAAFHNRLLSLPYPLSPKQDPVWLIATMSAAHSQQRRNIIRATWQTLYHDPAITMRFVISQPGELWMPVVQDENRTYEDIVMLPHLEESAHAANTVKSIEFLGYVAQCGSSWRFVSKLDDDSFLDAFTFYREFIQPRLDQAPNRTMIARHMHHWDPDFEYPGGQFYTFSWELVTLLARLYSLNPITDEHEDVVNGRLLHEAGEWFEFIPLDNPRAFDYDEANADEWAWSHRVGKGAINPHKLKDDETYLRVAAMYDRDGVKGH